MISPVLLEKMGLNVSERAIAEVADILAEVEDELCAGSASTIATVQEVASVTIHAGGKRLRPMLTICAAMATGLPYDRSRVVKLGACLEMVHMATLIHDDVIDESKTRRGHPTAACIHGNTAAILSGDVLLARAMRLLALDGDVRIIRAVSQAVVDLAEGEVWELEVRGRFDLSDQEHREIVEKKTASLISTCCRVGAMVAGASELVEVALARYGARVGTAFQFADDLLDFHGEESRTGKPVGTDFREGQATLPLILLRDMLTSGESEFVSGKFGNGVTPDDIALVCQWMRERGAAEQSAVAAQTEGRLAVESLSALPESPARNLLQAIAAFVADRTA